MARGSGSTPGILQPGDSGRIAVYYLGLSEPVPYPQVTFTLSRVTPGDARPIDEKTSRTASSFDPNAKFGPAGFGTSAFVSGDGALAYSIRYYNDSIDTSLVSNTIDANPPTTTMAALAPFTTRDFLVQWSASDDAAGVTSYDVFVSENGGDYVSWLQGTTNTSATFSGTAGHTYAFYARARDRVGNSRPTPSTPDTQTTVFTDGPLVLSPFLAPSGDFGFIVSVQIDRPYAIQVSTSLASWQTVTNVSARAATIQFSDEDTRNQTRRYYRVTTP